MKNFFKKLTGLDKLEEKLEQTNNLIAETEKKAEEAVKAAEEAKAAELLAKSTPKERATAKGEPWVSVLDTHVNKDNIRNGFFELDWNDLFVLQLKQAGYGFDGDPDEEIVDRWFRDIVKNMLAEEGQDTTRGAGYINVVPITKDKSEVS
jgi:ssDNA-specific exonuclease RecJ